MRYILDRKKEIIRSASLRCIFTRLLYSEAKVMYLIPSV